MWDLPDSQLTIRPFLRTWHTSRPRAIFIRCDTRSTAHDSPRWKGFTRKSVGYSFRANRGGATSTHLMTFCVEVSARHLAALPSTGRITYCPNNDSAMTKLFVN